MTHVAAALRDLYAQIDGGGGWSRRLTRSMPSVRHAEPSFFRNPSLGWKLVPDRFDDGGISGATMEAASPEATPARDLRGKTGLTWWSSTRLIG